MESIDDDDTIIEEEIIEKTILYHIFKKINLILNTEHEKSTYFC
jgi:hypothetical protein